MPPAEALAEDTSEVSTTYEGADTDLMAVFCRDVSQARLLTRDEEESLTSALMERRSAVRELLSRHPRLVARAIANGGKGTLDPTSVFREREALRVLEVARREAVHRRGSLRVKRLVAVLDRELGAYRQLRDRMIAANLRLVISIARRYHHPTLSQLDLIQEGALGLIRAIERYEPQRGIRFSTYAVWWIWQQLARAADNFGNVIRTPVHWNQFRRKAKRDGVSTDDHASDDALHRLADECGVPAAYARAMEQGIPCVPLDAPVGDGELVLANLLGDSSCDPAALSEGRDLGVRIGKALAELPAREQDVLRLRFGLTSSATLTLEEIGRRYGVSRERIRQIEARAIEQLRDICLQFGLHEYVN